MTEGKVLYARHDGLVELKFIGRIRLGDAFRVSASLDNFVDQLFEKRDFEKVVIDLSETENLDSTNLGLLAKIGRLTKELSGHQATIISGNPDIDLILRNVGFDQVFLIVPEGALDAESLASLEMVDDEEKDFAQMVLESHRTLSELNEENREAFRNIIDVFESEIRELGDP